jgi:hypothetical protein
MSRAISLTLAFMLVTYGLFGLSVGAWAHEAEIQPDGDYQ